MSDRVLAFGIWVMVAAGIANAQSIYDPGLNPALLPPETETSPSDTGARLALADPYRLASDEESSKLEAKDDPKPLTEEDVEKIVSQYLKEKAEKEKEEKEKSAKKDSKKEEKKWYDKLSMRGYTQVRFNQELFEDDPSAPAHYVADRSVSEDQSFLIRRARLILFGDVNDYLYLYFQPDFANTPTGSTDQNHFVQIRDLYADVYLDKEKVFRFRVGQSKIPYGWENLQSSQNRVPLDRNDSLNSAVRNERDLGVMFYYTPKPAQKFFKDVNDLGLKGSGNYGIFGVGAYNGQGGSLQEQNDSLHFVSRLTLPYCLENGQRVEAGLQGIVGKYAVLSSGIRPLGAGPGTFRPDGTVETGNSKGWNDQRIAATWVWYPQPLGFQTEWSVGRGPSLNAAQTAIEEQDLRGGYLMWLYKLDRDCGTFFPFVRWSYFEGGYKSERNAPYSEINEWEFGTEWQINSAAELTMEYLTTDRTNTSASTPAGVAPYQQFIGDVLRVQFQFNY